MSSKLLTLWGAACRARAELYPLYCRLTANAPPSAAKTDIDVEVTEEISHREKMKDLNHNLWLVSAQNEALAYRTALAHAMAAFRKIEEAYVAIPSDHKSKDGEDNYCAGWDMYDSIPIFFNRKKMDLIERLGAVKFDTSKLIRMSREETEEYLATLPAKLDQAAASAIAEKPL